MILPITRKNLARVSMLASLLFAGSLFAEGTLLWPSGDLAKDLKEWKMGGPSGTKIRISKEEFEGQPALILEVPPDVEDSWSVGISTERQIHLSEGKSYDVSFFMKALGDLKADVITTGENNSGKAHARIFVSSEWQEYTVTMTMDGASERVFLRLGDLGKNESTIMFSNLRIQEHE